MKRAVLLGLMLLIPAGVLAQVSYTLDSRPEEVDVTVSIELDCGDECPVSGWNLPSWPLPEDTEVISVKDSMGPVKSYEVTNGSLSIETNTGEPRREDKVRIKAVLNSDGQPVYEGLRKRSISLPGVPGEETTVVLQGEDILSWRSGYGFSQVGSSDSPIFRGKGPVNIRFKSGRGYRTENYVFFGSKGFEGSKEAYSTAVSLTGLEQSFDRFPVSSMSSGVFNATVGEWSAGEYVSGSIKLRRDMDSERKASVLAHETVHGLLDRKLDWDRTSSSYIQEGVAESVETAFKRRRDSERVPELFGEEKSFTTERNGRRYRVTVPPNGDRDTLETYYEADLDFMENWNPMNSPDTRRFGYAYSELIVRNHLMEENTSLRSLIDRLDPGHPISDPQEKWRFYSSVLDTSPCSDAESLERCLEDVRAFELPDKEEIRDDYSVVSETDEVELDQREVDTERNSQNLSAGKDSASEELSKGSEARNSSEREIDHLNQSKENLSSGEKDSGTGKKVEVSVQESLRLSGDEEGPENTHRSSDHLSGFIDVFSRFLSGLLS